MRVNYVIVFVGDMNRSVSFYRNILGLSLKFETTEWTEFATEGATFALPESEGSNPDEVNQQSVPAGMYRHGLKIQNLEEFHKRMTEKDVTCIQELKEVFGAKIAQYLDPDGLAISVSE